MWAHLPRRLGGGSTKKNSMLLSLPNLIVAACHIWAQSYRSKSHMQGSIFCLVVAQRRAGFPFVEGMEILLDGGIRMETNGVLETEVA